LFSESLNIDENEEEAEKEKEFKEEEEKIDDLPNEKQKGIGSLLNTFKVVNRSESKKRNESIESRSSNIH
jgi:hypothetical protein